MYFATVVVNSQNLSTDRRLMIYLAACRTKRTKKSTKFSYPSLKSAILPVAHFDDILIPAFKKFVLLMLDLD